jgi:dTDP-glucose 4,6-dehydratase
MIIITGGAGFIGSAMVEYLLNLEGFTDSILIVDKLSYAADLRNVPALHTDPKVSILVDDICNSEVISEFIDENTTIINFAAESHVDRSIEGAKPFLDSNIMGAAELFRAFHSKGGKTFLQVSTDEVYGSIDAGEATEDSILDPRSPYSATKASADLVLMAYAKTFDLDLRITRCGNNFGPRQHPEKLIPKVIVNILQDKKIPIYGNGSNIRNWIYVEDHCRAIWQVIKMGQKHSVYNVAGLISHTNIELVDMILSEMNAANSLKCFVEDRLGHDLRYAISGEKIRAELDFVPNADFKSSLKSTIDWYVSNAEWWNQKL